MAKDGKTLGQRVERLEKVAEHLATTVREVEMHGAILESILIGLIRRHGLTMADMQAELARVQEERVLPPGVLEIALERTFQNADRGRRGH